jgi:hypothetical protein
MKREELVQYLRASGCVLLREGGRHSWQFKPLNSVSTESGEDQPVVAEPRGERIHSDLSQPTISIPFVFV